MHKNNQNHADEAKALEIKKELREKSKILEEKMKELRMKEGEYGKVLQQKERLSKEVCQFICFNFIHIFIHFKYRLRDYIRNWMILRRKELN